MAERTPRIVRVRAVKDYELKAMALPTPTAYWVTCRVCPPGTPGPFDFFESLFGDARARLGWAPTWEIAMAFADAHAALHADKACPTCHHIPDVPVSNADTGALMRARA